MKTPQQRGEDMKTSRNKLVLGVLALACVAGPALGQVSNDDLRVLKQAASASEAPRPTLAAPTAPWTGARLPDGQPDVRGFYNPDKQGTYSLTFPSNGGTGEVIRNLSLQDAGHEVPAWPSRVIDPADGQIPYQPWARAKQKAVEANIDWPTKQEHLDPQGRCFPDGIIRNPLWTGFQIQQFPGYVLITFDQNHTYRIIPLDGRPPIDDRIKLWMSDSRGRWEGNTLVVTSRNNNAKHRLTNIGDFTSDKVTLTEWFTFNSPGSYEWRVRVEDPSVFTRPWTLWAKFNRTNQDDPNFEQWEQACHEGEKNALESLLTPAQAAEAKRLAERAAKTDAAQHRAKVLQAAR